MPSRELDKLIVDHLADIDAAAMALSALEAEVFSAIDGAASAWANERAWIGEFSYLDHGLWLAPQKWCLPGSKPANDSLLGYFQLEVGAGDTENSQRGEDYFYLTRLCRVGKGEIGFRFRQDIVRERQWQKRLKETKFQIPGFSVDSEPSLFLPVHLEIDKLSNCLDRGTFEGALQPFMRILEGLEAALPQFEGLIEELRSSTKARKST